MKVTVSWRDRDVIEVELHVWKRHEDQDDDAPTLYASGGGQAERAANYGDPATIAGFGFQRRKQ